MNENQLETFLAIVRCGSYSRAAQALYLSQPTLSYRVQTLEEELGVRLFARRNFQATLTPAGKAFLPEAQGICQAMEAARQQMMQYLPAREITIGFPEMMLQGQCRSFLMVMQLMPEGSAPLSSCKLSRPPEDVQQLSRGEVDLIFTDLDQPALADPRFEKRRLFDDRCYVCMRQDHPLASQKQLTLAQLRDVTIRRYDDLTCFLAQISRRLDVLGIQMDDSDRHLTFVQLLPRLAASGGVIISNQRPIPNPQLRFIPLHLDSPIDVGIAWRRDNCPPPLRHLIHALADLPEEAWL
ncbi:MAG: LysR family transcriptional regulator [Clostridia bacterium]|nr:LysR family transcriptional regulator [Clostridia bacterium]